MKILQKDGKCTIESEGAAKTDESYTIEQFISDLLVKTERDEIRWWRRHYEGSPFTYYTSLGDLDVGVEHGFLGWFITKPFADDIYDTENRQSAPRKLILAIERSIRRRMKRETIEGRVVKLEKLKKILNTQALPPGSAGEEQS